RPLRWVSEPDGGIYEAQNKGWRMATAPWVLFLNAGDALASPDVRGWVLPHLADGVDIVYGDLRLERGAGELRTEHYPVRISSAWLMKESVPHPAQFTRRALLEQFGGFDTRYRIAADYAFFARAFWQGRAHTRHAGLVISTFDTRGLSSDPARKGRLA